MPLYLRRSHREEPKLDSLVATNRNSLVATIVPASESHSFVQTENLQLSRQLSRCGFFLAVNNYSQAKRQSYNYRAVGGCFEREGGSEAWNCILLFKQFPVILFHKSSRRKILRVWRRLLRFSVQFSGMSAR
jgi:hypothetical protein